MDDVFDAQVIAAYGRHALVRDAAGAVREARPAGRKLDYVCGDRVTCRDDAAHDEVHMISVQPRSTALLRSTVRGGGELVVANLTLLVAVVAPAPAPDLFIVDRYLAAAASGSVQGVIVINKMDMPGSAELSAALEPYRRIGYEVFECSAQQPASLDLLSERLRAHTSVFVGQSGVGKSSLAAQLVPGSDIAVGGLARDDEGRHTTTASRLYDLPGGGALIDSPGVRDFAPAIAALEPKSLGFIEVERLAPGCRFQDCRHMREPGCAVMAAVDSGGFDARRYESYRRLRRLFEDLTAARGPVRRS